MTEFPFWENYSFEVLHLSSCCFHFLAFPVSETFYQRTPHHRSGGQSQHVASSWTPCLTLFSEEFSHCSQGDNGSCVTAGFICVESSKSLPLMETWPMHSVHVCVAPTPKNLWSHRVCVFVVPGFVFAHTEREVHTHPDLFSTLPSRPNHERNHSPTVSLCNSWDSVGLRSSRVSCSQ